MLAQCVTFDVPTQDLSFRLSRMSTCPRSGVRLGNVRPQRNVSDLAPTLPAANECPAKMRVRSERGEHIARSFDCARRSLDVRRHSQFDPEPCSGGRVFRAGEKQPQGGIFMQLHAIIAASALAISSATAFAQSPPAGAAADPNTKQNVQPAPSAANPADPAAAANPSAAQPTAPASESAAPSASEGASTGEFGSSASAADPNAKQNTLPAPSNMKPADPAAGNNPDAAAPTAP